MTTYQHPLSIGCIVAFLATSQLFADTTRPTEPTLLDYTVVNRFAHSRTAFTQGLIIEGNTLIESSGHYGKSYIAKTRLNDGTVIAEKHLPANLFAEGLTQLGTQLYQLTYRAGLLLVYDAQTLTQQQQFRYSGEGWGLTNDGEHLILSDGTNVLKFFAPDRFTELNRISVTEGGRALKYINELEWVEGEIYANVWLQNRIVIINPKNGIVRAYIDLQKLFETMRAASAVGVLNGIAYDRKTRRLFITGKYWPALFEIKINH